MSIAPPLNPERFNAFAQQLVARVSALAPAAAVSIDHAADAYACASWRLDGRTDRELFVEQPGAAIAPLILRVGIYCRDAPAATALAEARTAAFEALTGHRATLQALGTHCTFTPGSRTRDDTVFGWSDRDLNEWLTAASAHRDLVWRRDLREGEPDVQKFGDVLVALVPVWLAWNSL
jgi:hypothetical protein